MPEMDETNRSEVELDSERSWFLYVGEIKTAGLNRFLVDPLSRRYAKPAACIHVVPDVLAYYPDEVFLVVGPNSGQAGPDTGERRNSRMTVREFAAVVSEDEVVRAVVHKILEDQGELIVNVFEATTELTLTKDPRVKIVGPDPQVAFSLNNKMRQYEMAAHLGIPVPDGSALAGYGEALAYAEKIFARGKKAFVSGAYSAGGSNSIVASTGEEITSRFEGALGGLLVTEFVEHRYDPTVLGIVASEEDVYIASVADQNIQGTRFMGSTFPTTLEAKTVEKLKEYARTVGRHMAGQGYRGAFGCDFIVDESSRIHFIEVNARKQGTTMETTLAMIHNLPGMPSFPELEFMAVMEGSLPKGLEEMDSTNSPLCWGTYNYKAVEDRLVKGYVPPSMDEQDLFSRAAAGEEGHIVLDHVGPQTHITAGGFVARVVAAGPTLGDVKKRLRVGARQVHKNL